MNILKAVSCGAILSVALALAAVSPAGAEPKAGKNKTVFENDKVIITEAIIKPGEGLPTADRSGAIYYYLSASTVERTFADGSKMTVAHKAGESFVNTEKRPYSVVNSGTTTAHVISVKLK